VIPLDYKPFSQWSSGDFEKLREDPGHLLFLQFAVKSALQRPIRAYFQKQGKSAETEIFDLARKHFLSDPPQPAWAEMTFRWFMGRYAFCRAVRFLLEARGKMPTLDLLSLATDIFMIRIMVSVALGLVVLCGMGPWEFLSLTQYPERRVLIAAALLFSFLYRYADVGKQTDRGLFVKSLRASSMTLLAYAYGWFWVKSATVLLAFSQADRAKQLLCDSAQRWDLWILPALGSAVGVVLQELWEEKPISEPI